MISHDAHDAHDAHDVPLVVVLAALADPVRLEIVRALAATDGELACGQIPVSVGKSTMSHHFKILREAGIVETREDGTRRLQRLRRTDLETRFPGLLDSVLRAAASGVAGRASSL
jgi:DNA-binding transcriptional ArsR family regulator